MSMAERELLHSWHEDPLPPRCRERRRAAVLASLRVLVVAATPCELELIERIGGVETLVCGVGPVEAALTCARVLGVRKPEPVVNVGIAGARTLEPGSIVLGAEAVYADFVDPGSAVARTDRQRPDPGLLERARAVLPDAAVVPIATTARVGGGHAFCEVEAMEGFSVLRAAAEAGLPALELRAISNRYDDDRAEWRLDDAFAALKVAVELLRGL